MTEDEAKTWRVKSSFAWKPKHTVDCGLVWLCKTHTLLMADSSGQLVGWMTYRHKLEAEKMGDVTQRLAGRP